MEKIIEALSTWATLTENDCKNLSNIIATKHLEKGQCWIEAGNKNDMIAFVETGYLRRFYFNDGNELTDFFYFENDFCADLPSLIGHTKPAASVVAMEQTVLTAFSYTDFNKLCDSSTALERLNRRLVEFTFLRFYNRALSFIMQTPKQRYDELVRRSPQIMQRAQQYHTASYLGINALQLERLRAEG